MTPLQRNVVATLDEMAETHQRLGLPPEPDEMAEAWFIVERIEAKLKAAKAAAE